MTCRRLAATGPSGPQAQLEVEGRGGPFLCPLSGTRRPDRKQMQSREMKCAAAPEALPLRTGGDCSTERYAVSLRDLRD
jgi:hypothetical protein